MGGAQVTSVGGILTEQILGWVGVFVGSSMLLMSECLCEQTRCHYVTEDIFIVLCNVNLSM